VAVLGVLPTTSTSARVRTVVACGAVLLSVSSKPSADSSEATVAELPWTPFVTPRICTASVTVALIATRGTWQTSVPPTSSTAGTVEQVPREMVCER
jgi:hypothetical protein